MAKSARDKIRLVSSAGTGHFYTTDKNKKNTPVTRKFVHNGLLSMGSPLPLKRAE